MLPAASYKPKVLPAGSRNVASQSAPSTMAVRGFTTSPPCRTTAASTSAMLSTAMHGKSPDSRDGGRPSTRNAIGGAHVAARRDRHVAWRRPLTSSQHRHRAREHVRSAAIAAHQPPVLRLLAGHLLNHL